MQAIKILAWDCKNCNQGRSEIDRNSRAGGIFMNRIRLIPSVTAFLFAIMLGTGTVLLLQHASAAPMPQTRLASAPRPYPDFQLEVLVNGRPVAEYYARGRTYVEALQGAEYELRVRNSSADRVAVALSVDGLNTIDARQ